MIHPAQMGERVTRNWHACGGARQYDQICRKNTEAAPSYIAQPRLFSLDQHAYDDEATYDHKHANRRVPSHADQTPQMTVRIQSCEIDEVRCHDGPGKPCSQALDSGDLSDFC